MTHGKVSCWVSKQMKLKGCYCFCGLSLIRLAQEIDTCPTSWNSEPTSPSSLPPCFPLLVMTFVKIPSLFVPLNYPVPSYRRVCERKVGGPRVQLRNHGTAAPLSSPSCNWNLLARLGWIPLSLCHQSSNEYGPSQVEVTLGKLEVSSRWLHDQICNSPRTGS